MPHWLLPPLMSNHGNYIVSLGNVCRWLAQQAEALGVEIYPGFAAAEVLYDDTAPCAAWPPATWASRATATHKPDYQPGMELHAKYTLFAEGCRGSLSQELMQQVQPARRRRSAEVRHRPQGALAGGAGQASPGLRRAQPGLAARRRAPAAARSCITSTRHLVAVGFVVHLNYANPHLSPYDEFQRFKTHPAIRGTFEGGKRLGYGARAINEGGLQSVPEARVSRAAR